MDKHLKGSSASGHGNIRSDPLHPSDLRICTYEGSEKDSESESERAVNEIKHSIRVGYEENQ